MIRLRKTRTWNDNLNDVVRDVFFVDEELLDLMCIPEKYRGDIAVFIQKYLVRDVTSDEVITNEEVRVCYWQGDSKSIGMNMIRKTLNFDIYVKDSVQHTASFDILQSRDQLIAEKIKELLTDSKYVCHINFRFEDSYDMYTKLVGYHRYRIVFSYKTSF